MWADRGRRMPEADYVVSPKNAQETSNVMKIANYYKIPVTTWGGGTQGGAIPVCGGILLDTKRMNEIYYFEFDKPQGFGFQAVYSKEGDINEVYKVKTGDLVEIPKGYHPFTVAPGYKNYCLWIMAGKNRGIFCTMEEEHKWK